MRWCFKSKQNLSKKEPMNKENVNNKKVVLSISIDLAGSTKAKQIIKSICKSDDWHDQTLRSYAHALENVEARLYETAIRKKFIRKLFLVKRIGDELWYTLQVDEDDHGTIYELLAVLKEIVKRVPILYVTSGTVEWNDAKPSENKPEVVETVALGFKCHIDIIEHATNMEWERIEKLSKRLISTFKEQKPDATEKQIYAFLRRQMSRLNMGDLRSVNDKIKVSNIRADLIGTDVDLFFRCASKYTLPGNILIGEKLYKKICNKSDEHNRMQIEILNPNGSSFKYFQYIKKKLPPNSMKGIEHPYTIYYLPQMFDTLSGP